MLNKLLQPLRKIFKLIYITPLFLGPLVFIPPMDLMRQHTFLKSYTFFLFFWASWAVLLNYVLKVYLPYKNSGKKLKGGKNGLFVLGLFLSAALCMAGIEFFRSAVPPTYFWTALCSMGLSALWFALLERKRYGLGFLACLFQSVGLSWLSFMITGFDGQWEPLLLCLSISCLLTACRMADHMVSTQGTVGRYIPGIQPILLFLGPIIVCISAASGILESAYMASVFLIPYTANIATMVQNCARAGSFTPQILRLSEAAAFMQIAILFALGIIQRYFYLF